MKLPKLRSEDKSREDADAMADAIARALAPVTKEIEDTVLEMRKVSDLNKTEFNAHAVTFTLERLAEAVEDLTKKAGPGEVSSEWVASSLKGFSDKNEKEQNAILGEMLKNSKFQTQLSRDFLRIVGEDLYENIDKLVEINELSRTDSKRAAEELMKIEREHERRASRGRSEGRTRGDKSAGGEDKNTGLLSKILNALDDPRSGFLAGITAGIDKLAFGIGGIGLASLLPKEVREFIGDFTGAFTTIKTLLKNSWLAPMFKILEHIPIFGAIIKKLPYLSAILAAFEVIPDVFDKYNAEGIWVALETALQGVYKFFVGDLLVLVGKLVDSIKNGLFGEDVAKKLDFTSMTETLNIAVSNVITDVAEMIKEFVKVLTTGVDDGSLDKLAYDLMWDIVDGLAATIRSLFKYDPEEEFSLRESVEGIWTGVKETFAKLAEDVKRWFSGDFTADEKYAVFKAFKYVVYDAPMAALASLAEQVKGIAMELGESALLSMRDGLISLGKFEVDMAESFGAFVSDLWVAAGEAIMNAIAEVIAAGLDLKDDVKAWFSTMWDAMKKGLYDNTFGLIPGLAREEDPVEFDGVDKTKIEEKKIRDLATPRPTHGGRGPVIAPTVINQNKSAQSNSYAIIGPRRASQTNPNQQSTGGN